MNRIILSSVFTIICSAFLSQSTYVPDDNFEQLLISIGADSGPLDDSVLTANINTVSHLSIFNSIIKDFTGIEDFLLLDTFYVSTLATDTIVKLDLSNNTALISLRIAGGFIDSINISNCVLLKDLFLGKSGLTYIELSNNVNLEYLHITNNPLDSLNVTNNRLLEYLNCEGDSLAALDITNNRLLKKIALRGNKLTTLDVSNNDSLVNLFCQNNQISSLIGISNLSKLDNFNCSFNQLSTIDVSANPLLRIISCRNNNNLTSLNLANGNNNTKLSQVYINFNPALRCVLVDDVRYSSMNWFGKDSSSYFSTNCLGGFGPRTYVPGNNFEAFLNRAGHDNGALDDSVFTANLDTFTNLDISSLGISSLEGIQDFDSLKRLLCYGNLIDIVDLSKNLALTYLDISTNNLDSLDLSNNLLLDTIGCHSNNIENLNLSNNLNLKYLICSDNNMRNLNISSNVNLEFLYCGTNNFSGFLDFSNNSKLSLLYIRNNLIDSIDISSCSLLKELDCSNNQLTSLDVSRNPLLLQISCSVNDLVHLDVSNNYNLSGLSCVSNQLISLNTNNGSKKFLGLSAHFNPGLACIQVNDTAYARSNWNFFMNTAVYNLDCGFVRRNIIDSVSCNNYITPSGLILSQDTVMPLDTIKDHIGLSDSIINVLNFKLDTSSSQIDTSIFASYTSPSGIVLTSSVLGFVDTLINSAGCDSLITINLNIKTCRAKYSKTQPAPGQVTLIDSTSGNNLKYKWYFGDGDSSMTMLPTHNYTSAGTYYVCLSIFDTVSLCSDMFCDSITVDSLGILRNSWVLNVVRNLTSMKEAADMENVSVYPNPNIGNFTLDMGEEIMKSRIFITDINGRLVKEIETLNGTKQEISIDTKPGLYFLNLVSGNNKKVVKIIIY